MKGFETDTDSQLVSFGSVFENIRFITNMNDLSDLSLELRTEDDATIVQWMNVSFEKIGVCVRVVGCFEITIDNVLVDASSTSAYLWVGLSNRETTWFRSDASFTFTHDRTEPMGRPSIEIVSTHPNSISAQFVGYTDFKTETSFEHAFEMECLNEFGRTQEKKTVSPGQCVDFLSLLPDTPYSIVCNVTTVPTGSRKGFTSRILKTPVDPEFVVVTLTIDADTPWVVVFETTHMQRLAVQAKRQTHQYKVKRNSSIQFKFSNEDVKILSISNFNHYQIHVKGTASNVEFSAIDWVVDQTTDMITQRKTLSYTFTNIK
jgi:hypothetical protein